MLADSRQLGARFAAMGALAIALLFARSAAAHAVGVSRADVAVDGPRVTAELAFARSELAAAFPDRDPLRADVIAGFAVAADGAPCAGALDDARDATDGTGDGALFRVTWTCPGAATRVSLAAPLLSSLSQGHRLVLHAHTRGAPLADEVLYAAHDHVDLALGAPSEATPSPTASPRGVAAFVAMGIEHILTGYDHLLFLLGLVLAFRKARPLFGVVTAFTVGHSITLALAALDVWSPSSRIVEPAIALSIAYVGVENLARRGGANRWRIALPFGLVHGFGFSAALREIALPRADVPAALFGFNVGVELGQLAVLALVLPALALLRRVSWFELRGDRALSGAIALAGLVWFVARVAA